MSRIKGLHFEKEIVALCINWHKSKGLSTRRIEEMMARRGVQIDHATISRWAKRYKDGFESQAMANNGKPSMTMPRHVKLKGSWKYLHLKLNKENMVIDFFVSQKEDKKAAMDFFADTAKNTLH